LRTERGFAVRTGGIYPVDAGSVTPGGLTLEGLCPRGVYLDNPFTDAPRVVFWDSDPVVPGIWA
jgi:hypothetical protein